MAKETAQNIEKEIQQILERLIEYIDKSIPKIEKGGIDFKTFTKELEEFFVDLYKEKSIYFTSTKDFIGKINSIFGIMSTSFGIINTKFSDELQNFDSLIEERLKLEEATIKRQEIISKLNDEFAKSLTKTNKSIKTALIDKKGFLQILSGKGGILGTLATQYLEIKKAGQGGIGGLLKTSILSVTSALGPIGTITEALIEARNEDKRLIEEKRQIDKKELEAKYDTYGEAYKQLLFQKETGQITQKALEERLSQIKKLRDIKFETPEKEKTFLEEREAEFTATLVELKAQLIVNGDTSDKNLKEIVRILSEKEGKKEKETRVEPEPKEGKKEKVVEYEKIINNQEEQIIISKEQKETEKETLRNTEENQKETERESRRHGKKEGGGWLSGFLWPSLKDIKDTFLGGIKNYLPTITALLPQLIELIINPATIAIIVTAVGAYFLTKTISDDIKEGDWWGALTLYAGAGGGIAPPIATFSKENVTPEKSTPPLPNIVNENVEKRKEREKKEDVRDERILKIMGYSSQQQPPSAMTYISTKNGFESQEASIREYYAILAGTGR